MASNKRKQGEGTIRLRKDGRWEGRVVIGYDEKGNPRTKNVLAKTKAECVEKLEALKEQCGRTSDRLKPEMPFGDWLDFWYQNFSKPKLRPTTQACYEGRIYTHIIPSIGQIPPLQAHAERASTVLCTAEKGWTEKARGEVRRWLI